MGRCAPSRECLNEAGSGRRPEESRYIRWNTHSSLPRYDPQIAYVLSRIKVLVTFAAGAVFVIACINVGSLLMARASRRSHETSLRVALGASRRELAGELLSDSVVISFAGGAFGALLAAWTAHIVPLFLFREDAERFVFAPHLAPIIIGSLLCCSYHYPLWNDSARRDSNGSPMGDSSIRRRDAIKSKRESLGRNNHWPNYAVLSGFHLYGFPLQNLRSALQSDARDGRGGPIILTVQTPARQQ